MDILIQKSLYIVLILKYKEVDIMRKYTSKSDKINMYSQKYGKTKEEMYKILTEDDCMLTLEELKIKYDDSLLDEWPDWLDYGQYDLIIWNTVHQMYDYRYSWWISEEDLHQDLWLWIRLRIRQYNSLRTYKGRCNK